MARDGAVAAEFMMMAAQWRAMAAREIKLWPAAEADLPNADILFH
jgi:hypothetical protein